MGINRFFQFFLPKESKFLPLLRGQVDDIIAASDLLIKFTATQSNTERQEIYPKIKKLEQDCDKLTNTILDELNKSFITPFDREDIHALASQLDDVLDIITSSAKRTVMYKPKKMHESATIMAEYIKESAESLKIAVYALNTVRKNPTIVKTEARRLHEIENRADDVYESFITELFETETDPIELMKQVEIIQLLEEGTDTAYRVSDVLKTIVVKYA